MSAFITIKSYRRKTTFYLLIFVPLSFSFNSSQRASSCITSHIKNDCTSYNVLILPFKNGGEKKPVQAANKKQVYITAEIGNVTNTTYIQQNRSVYATHQLIECDIISTDELQNCNPSIHLADVCVSVCLSAIQIIFAMFEGNCK